MVMIGSSHGILVSALSLIVWPSVGAVDGVGASGGEEEHPPTISAAAMRRALATFLVID
jgi:hypothetical protein